MDGLYDEKEVDVVIQTCFNLESYRSMCVRLKLGNVYCTAFHFEPPNRSICLL